MKFTFDQGYFDTITKEEFIKLHTQAPVYRFKDQPESGLVHEGITAEQAAELYEKHAPKKEAGKPAKEKVLP